MPLILVRLNKQGNSRDLKKMIIIRYLSLFIIFTPQWIRFGTYVFGHGSINDAKLIYIEGILTIFIGIIRIQEPLI